MKDISTHIVTADLILIRNIERTVIYTTLPQLTLIGSRLQNSLTRIHESCISAGPAQWRWRKYAVFTR